MKIQLKLNEIKGLNVIAFIMQLFFLSQSTLDRSESESWIHSQAAAIYVSLSWVYIMQIIFLVYQFIPISSTAYQLVFHNEKQNEKPLEKAPLSIESVVQNSSRDDILENILGVRALFVNLAFAFWYILRMFNLSFFEVIGPLIVAIASWNAYFRVVNAPVKSQGDFACIQFTFGLTASVLTFMSFITFADTFFPLDFANTRATVLPCIIILGILGVGNFVYLYLSSDIVPPLMHAFGVYAMLFSEPFEDALDGYVEIYAVISWTILISFGSLIFVMSRTPLLKSQLPSLKALNLFSFIVLCLFAQMGKIETIRRGVYTWISPHEWTELLWFLYFGLYLGFLWYQYSGKGSLSRDVILSEHIGPQITITNICLIAWIYGFSIHQFNVRLGALFAASICAFVTYLRVSAVKNKSGADFSLLQIPSGVLGTWGLYNCVNILAQKFIPIDGLNSLELLPISLVVLGSVVALTGIYTLIKHDMIPGLVVVCAISGILSDSPMQDRYPGWDTMKTFIMFFEFFLFTSLILSPFLGNYGYLKKLILKRSVDEEASKMEEMN